MCTSLAEHAPPNMGTENNPVTSAFILLLSSAVKSSINVSVSIQYLSSHSKTTSMFDIYDMACLGHKQLSFTHSAFQHCYNNCFFHESLDNYSKTLQPFFFCFCRLILDDFLEVLILFMLCHVLLMTGV